LKEAFAITFLLKIDNYHYLFLSLRRERLGEGELLLYSYLKASLILSKILDWYLIKIWE
jgi:hypothetical protein